MYEDYYGLSGRPFQLSPDARFFFNSAGHTRAMAYLRYGLRQGEGFIVITGGIGTGKSTLVNNLFAELDHDSIVAAHILSTQIDEEEVLQLISASFDLAYEGLSKAALLRNLEAFFRARRADNQRVLLVVDEAQNLPRRSIEELRMLSNYQEDGQALLQSFLLGQAELKQTLQSPEMEQVRQRIIAGFHLRPLDRKEIQAYIEHRLNMVGWDKDPEITDEAYDALFSATEGVPRQVNNLCERLMLFGSLEELHRIDGEHVNVVIEAMVDEVGHTQPDWVDPSIRFDKAKTDPDGDDQDLDSRVAALELEVSHLRSQLSKTRRLVKQSILLQIDEDDDSAI